VILKSGHHLQIRVKNLIGHTADQPCLASTQINIVPAPIKKALTSVPKVSAFHCDETIRAKGREHSLRQPGGPDFRTRGFASPDLSGFALIGDNS